MANSPDLNNLTVVCISTVSWNHPTPTNKQRLMKLLAKNQNVIYVEDPVLPFTYLRQRRFEHAQNILPKLTVIRPWKLLPWGAKFPWIASINAKLLSWQIRRKLPYSTRFLLWIYEPTSSSLAKIFKSRADFILTDLVDDYRNFPGSGAWIEKHTKELIELSDLVTTSSHIVAEKFPNVIHVPNGADCDDCCEPISEKVREWVRSIPTPRVLFMGTLNFKINWELVKKLSAQYSSTHFIFVGPGTGPQDLPPNVHIHPAIPGSQIGTLYTMAEGAFLPYQQNTMTETVSPLKALEALNAGLPVWSTSIPETTLLKDYLFLDEARFEEFLDALPTWDMKAHRENFRRLERTWKGRLEKILHETSKRL